MKPLLPRRVLHHVLAASVSSALLVTLVGCLTGKEPLDPVVDGGSSGSSGASSGSGSSGGAPDSGGSSGGTSSSSGFSSSGSSCTAAPVYNCGTSAAGTLACFGGQVCCLYPGCDANAADPYTANGAVSRCMAPGAQSGPNDRCPSPAIQLCATGADCGAGYDCDATYYCKPKSGGSSGGNP